MPREGFTVERFSSSARKFALMAVAFLVLSVGKTEANTLDNTVTHKTKVETQKDYQLLLESILSNPARVTACHRLVMTLDGTELQSGILDDMSGDLYEQVLLKEPPLTQEDMLILLSVETSQDRLQMIDACTQFMADADAYALSQPDRGASDPSAYQQIMIDAGMSQYAVEFVFPPDEADSGYGGAESVFKRMSDVVTQIMTMRESIDRLYFATQFYGKKFDTKYSLLDPRTTADQVFASLKILNRKSLSPDIYNSLNEVIKNQADYKLVWRTGGAGGYFDIVAIGSGQVVVRGNPSADGGLVEYHVRVGDTWQMFTSMDAITRLDAQGHVINMVPKQSFGQRISRGINSMAASFRINLNVNAGIRIQVAGGKTGSAGSGWNFADNPFTRQVQWQHKQFQYRPGNFGSGYNYLLGTTDVERGVHDQVVANYEAGFEGTPNPRNNKASFRATKKPMGDNGLNPNHARENAQSLNTQGGKGIGNNSFLKNN